MIVSMVWYETILKTVFSLMYIFMCNKVDGHVTFLYEGSMYTRYVYYVYVEFYLHLQVEVINDLNFPLNYIY